MKILKRIIIENFQCHKKTIVKPAESGLTIITGPTDHGKSAIVRAIRWLLYNRPLGNDFIRHGQTECKVTFEYEDGATVIRRRTVSLNQYYVDDQLFEGFGNDVPLEVQKATSVYDYNVAGENLKLNVAEQLAGPFLGSSISAPLRAKILGKLAGTEDIDRANKKLGTDMYHGKQDQKRLEEEIFILDSDIENYEWVKPLGKKIKLLQQIYDQVKVCSEKLKILKTKKKQLDEINASFYIQKQQIKQYEVLPKVFEIIKSNEPNIRLLIDFIKKNNQLNQLAEQIKKQELIIWKSGQPEKTILQLKNISRLELDLRVLKRANKKFNDIKVELIETEKNIKESGKPVESLKMINECTTKANRSKKLLDNWYKLIDIKENIKIHNDKLIQYQDIEKGKNIIFIINIRLMKLEDLQVKKVNFDDCKKEVTYYSTKIKLQKDALLQHEEMVIQTKEKYKQVLKKAGICPYCGSEVNDDCLEHVM